MDYIIAARTGSFTQYWGKDGWSSDKDAACIYTSPVNAQNAVEHLKQHHAARGYQAMTEIHAEARS